MSKQIFWCNSRIPEEIISIGVRDLFKFNQDLSKSGILQEKKTLFQILIQINKKYGVNQKLLDTFYALDGWFCVALHNISK